jgi:hypothetical protein
MRKLILLLPLLAACGKEWMIVTEDPVDPPGTDEARVVVYRDSYRNATKPYAFLDDEELLGFSLVGTWFEVRCTPGEHFFVLHGVSSSGVRATLEAGRTYFLRVDSVPRFLHLDLRLTPIVPGMKEFDRIDEILADLDRVEPIDVVLAEFSENHADDFEASLASLKTDRFDQCVILSPEAGR